MKWRGCRVRTRSRRRTSGGPSRTSWRGRSPSRHSTPPRSIAGGSRPDCGKTCCLSYLAGGSTPGAISQWVFRLYYHSELYIYIYGVGKSGFNCWGVRRPVLMFILVLRECIWNAAPWVILHVRWSLMYLKCARGLACPPPSL